MTPGRAKKSTSSVGVPGPMPLVITNMASMIARMMMTTPVISSIGVHLISKMVAVRINGAR